jgi:hypothetical protein
MKFRTHTTLYPMTMRDVEDASTQGGMLPIVIGGKIYGQSVTYRPVEEKMMAYEEELQVPMAPIILITGSAVMGVGAIILLTTVFWIMRRRYRAQAIASAQPLMSADEKSAAIHFSDSSIYHLRGDRKDVSDGIFT